MLSYGGFCSNWKEILKKPLTIRTSLDRLELRVSQALRQGFLKSIKRLVITDCRTMSVCFGNCHSYQGFDLLLY